MRCDQFEQRLNELLDERANPGEDQRLVQHATRCPACRGLLEAQRIVLSLLQQRKLLQQASRRAAARSPVRRSPRRRPVEPPATRNTTRLALLTAACVATLLVCSWIAPSAPRQGRSQRNRVGSLPTQLDLPPLPADDAASHTPMQAHSLPAFGVDATRHLPST